MAKVESATVSEKEETSRRMSKILFFTSGVPLETCLRMASELLPSINKSNDSTSGNESEENSAAGR